MTSGHFLGERYLSSTAADALIAPDATPGERGAARHLWTIVVADDELCLQLFEADSRADLDALAQRSGVTFDRVSPVRLLLPGRPGGHDEQPAKGDDHERLQPD
jgi:hypothetical protein